MVPVVLSILLVVLISGAVLWVVAGDRVQPTSEAAAPVDAPAEIPAGSAAPPPPPHRQATSRRRPPPVAGSVAVEAQPASTAARLERAVGPASVRMSGVPLPRHRARSAGLLVLLVLFVGVLLAVVIGVVVVVLAYALRAAVTS